MPEVFAAALEEVSPFDAETIADRFDFDEIRTVLEDSGVDEPDDVLTLTPNP